jgi:hypothetical protein
MITRFANAGLLLLLAGTACTITYRDPFGGETTVGFPDNPPPDQAASAFVKLEEAMGNNLRAMRLAVTEANPQMFELASANVERIAEAKVQLRPYLPK